MCLYLILLNLPTITSPIPSLAIDTNRCRVCCSTWVHSSCSTACLTLVSCLILCFPYLLPLSKLLPPRHVPSHSVEMHIHNQLYTCITVYPSHALNGFSFHAMAVILDCTLYIRITKTVLKTHYFLNLMCWFNWSMVDLRNCYASHIILICSQVENVVTIMSLSIWQASIGLTNLTGHIKHA